MIKLMSFIIIERKKNRSILEKLKNVPNVIKIMTISGEADILIEIETENSDDAVNVIENVEKIDGITEIHSHFVIDEWRR